MRKSGWMPRRGPSYRLVDCCRALSPGRRPRGTAAGRETSHALLEFGGIELRLFETLHGVVESLVSCRLSSVVSRAGRALSTASFRVLMAWTRSGMDETARCLHRVLQPDRRRRSGSGDGVDAALPCPGIAFQISNRSPKGLARLEMIPAARADEHWDAPTHSSINDFRNSVRGHLSSAIYGASISFSNASSRRLRGRRSRCVARAAPAPGGSHTSRRPTAGRRPRRRSE